MYNVVLVLQPSIKTITDKSTPFDVAATFSHYRLILTGELKITWTVRIIWPDPLFETSEDLKLSVTSETANLFEGLEIKPMVSTKGEVVIAATANVNSNVAQPGVEYTYNILINVATQEGMLALRGFKIDPIMIISG